MKNGHRLHMATSDQEGFEFGPATLWHRCGCFSQSTDDFQSGLDFDQQAQQFGLASVCSGLENLDFPTHHIQHEVNFLKLAVVQFLLTVLAHRL